MAKEIACKRCGAPDSGLPRPDGVCGECYALPWFVMDAESEGRETLIGRFATEDAAADFIGTQDPAKVARGGFSLVGPSEDE